MEGPALHLEPQGPAGEECLDGYLIRRTTNKATLDATTNAGEVEELESGSIQS